MNEKLQLLLQHVLEQTAGLLFEFDAIVVAVVAVEVDYCFH